MTADAQKDDSSFVIPRDIPMQPVLDEMSIEVGRLVQQNKVMSSRVKQLTDMLIAMGGKLDE